MTTHTPGPWIVDDGSKSVLGGFRVHAKTGRPKPTPSATGYAVRAAPWPHGPAPEDKRMQEANARLIAASPDMLDALKVAVVYDDRRKALSGGKLPTKGQWEIFIDRARAVIARAEGR